MQTRLRVPRGPVFFRAFVLMNVLCFSTLLQAGSHSNRRVLARGGGKTIIEGGSAGLIPVLTTVAFHAERGDGALTGDFECLALAPQAATGPSSGQFTVNAMYVTGNIRSAAVDGDTATLAGTATITGIGAGTNVPFTFVVREGGPGATAVLTTEGSPRLVFKEILLEGSFQVFSEDGSKD